MFIICLSLIALFCASSLAHWSATLSTHVEHKNKKARGDSVICIQCMCITEAQLGDSPYIKELEGKKGKPSNVMVCVIHQKVKSRTELNTRDIKKVPRRNI